MLETAGINHPYYTGFLGRVDDKYSVVERHLLVQDNGDSTPDWSQAKLVDPLINDFRLLQYDAMFGHKHAVDRLFPGLRKPAGV
jgi:phosphoglycerol transferase MdoB-like AlkP superfamily enzyme